MCKNRTEDFLREVSDSAHTLRGAPSSQHSLYQQSRAEQAAETHNPMYSLFNIFIVSRKVGGRVSGFYMFCDTVGLLLLLLLLFGKFCSDLFIFLLKC